MQLDFPLSSVINVPTGNLAGRTDSGTGKLEAIAPDSTLALSSGSLGLNLGNVNTWTVEQNISLSPAANASGDGLVLSNPTPATLNNQQFSPRIRLTGNGWATTPGASQETDWIIENQPVQGAANPNSNLVFSQQINGGGYAAALSITGPGTLQIGTVSLKDQSLSGQLSVGNNYYFQSSEFAIYNGNSIAFSAGSIGVNPDIFLSRKAAANLQLGQADAAESLAQTLSVQSVAAGTSNTNGQSFTIQGSRGTGTGSGGSIVFQTSPGGLTGTAQNALTTAMSIAPSGTVTVNNLVSNNSISSGGVNSFLGPEGLATGNPTLALSTNSPIRSCLVVTCYPGATANASEWRNNNNNVLLGIDATGNINSAVAQTTYNGSVSGSAVWSMPFQGPSYKRFVVHFSALKDAGGTITYPIAFSQTPTIYGDSAALAISSTSTSTFTISAASGVSGFVIVEGY